MLPCQSALNSFVEKDSHPNSKTFSMAGIMCLPLEIRIMIYEHCLVVNHTVGPRRPKYLKPNSGEEAWKGVEPSRPTVSLLAVSKTVGSEAAQVLYGKNKWQVSSYAQNPFQLFLGDLESRNTASSLWSSRAPLFRHVTLDFAVVGYRARALLDIGKQLSMTDIARPTLYSLTKTLAERYITSLCGTKVDIMKQMPNLSSITIHYYQFLVPVMYEVDSKFMHRILLRFCRSWRGNSIGDGKPRWPPLNITIADLDPRARGMIRRIDPRREWLDESFHEIPTEAPVAIGWFGTLAVRLCTMKSPYIPEG